MQSTTHFYLFAYESKWQYLCVCVCVAIDHYYYILCGMFLLYLFLYIFHVLIQQMVHKISKYWRYIFFNVCINNLFK